MEIGIWSNSENTHRPSPSEPLAMACSPENSFLEFAGARWASLSALSPGGAICSHQTGPCAGHTDQPRPKRYPTEAQKIRPAPAGLKVSSDISTQLRSRCLSTLHSHWLVPAFAPHLDPRGSRELPGASRWAVPGSAPMIFTEFGSIID